MNVQNLGIKFTIVAVVLALALLALYPPDKKLKPGIDLAGGHSLLYEIDTTGLNDAQQVDLAQRIINQLRKRVDPNNQRNLVWRPMGNTRIEIQMPSATGRARELRDARDASIERVLELDVSRSTIRAALEGEVDARQSAFETINEVLARRGGQLAAALSGEGTEEPPDADAIRSSIAGCEALAAQRLELLQELADKYDAYRLVKSGEGEAGSADEVSAFTDYEQARERLLATNLSRARLMDLLDLERGPFRKEQISKLKGKYAASGYDLDQLVPIYDQWAKDRGLLEDPEDLKRLLRGAGVLEFRIMAQRDDGNPSLLRTYKQPVSDYVQQLQDRGPRPKPGQPFQWLKIQDPLSYLHAKDMEEVKQRSPQHPTVIEAYGGQYYVLAHAEPDYGLLAGSESKWKLVRALSTRDFNTGRPIVQFQLDPRGGDLFAKLTRANINRQLGIFLDNECMSSANIEEEIRESGQIRGDFSVEDINYLVNTLEAGSLPARLKEPPLSERSIGSSLGEGNRIRGLNAAMGGLALVAVFMVVYYLLSGLVANVALFLNIIMVLGAVSVLEATFTLPGIAGLILTVGMSVDANVLIFERIREELRRGASLKMAVKNGYEKAFSTIWDANFTTMITCAILGFAGSEEVKGFAIVLGLGVCFSMITALFVTRIIFAALIQNGIIKSLPMLSIVGQPQVQWLGLRRVFWPVSIVLVSCGAALFISEHLRHKANIYDIEFLGGTAVTIELREGVTLSDDEVRSEIHGGGPEDSGPGSAAGWLRHAAGELSNISVTPATQPGVFELSSPVFNAQQLETMVMTALPGVLEPVQRGGLEVLDSHTIRIAAKSELQYDLERVKNELAAGALILNRAATNLSTAKVVVAWDSVADRGEDAHTFDIVTTETNKDLVRQAILAALGDRLKIQQPLEYVVRTDAARAPQGYYPVYLQDKKATSVHLGDIIGSDTVASVDGYHGGAAMVFDALRPPQTEEQLRDRLHSARLLPEFEKYKYRPFEIIGLSFGPDDAEKPVDQRRLDSFALLVSDDSLIYEDDPRTWETELATPELSLARLALGSQKTLQKVTQFAPQIAAQMTQQAIMAILLALVAIVIYISARFRDMHFGLAAIVALVHDVTISLGFVAISYYIYGLVGDNALLIEDFKIDLPMIAALLTIVGYSLNDTIVVFDRIRENRGKLKDINEAMVNHSINQTISRTILTSVTTLLAVLVMYLLGGQGIHGFSYAMIIGVLVGTYSSVAIATPLLLYPTLLKWIIYFIIGLVLVGLAMSLSQREFQVIMWIVTGIFAVGVIVSEARRGGGVRRPVVGGAA